MRRIRPSVTFREKGLHVAYLLRASSTGGNVGRFAVPV